MSEPIRVLHVFRSLNIGGAESMIMNLYRTIDKDVLQFDFVVHIAEKGAFAPEVEEMGGRIYVCPSYKGTNYLAYIKWWKKFFSEHNEYKVIHAHVRSAAALFLPVAKRFGLKTISHSHTSSNGSGVTSFLKKCLQYPIRYKADYLFGCSKASGVLLFGKRAVKGNRFYILKNAIDTDLYCYNPDIRKKYRDELGIMGHTVYIHIGSLRQPKNHLFLLDVFFEIHAQQPDSVLLLAGDGDLRGEIEKRIEELKLTDAVTLLGTRKDIPNLLQTADCFLFPSLWEGLPVSVIEAQAAGLPCFISDRITTEVDLSELVIRLPIDQGAGAWSEQILKCKNDRIDVSEKIKDAGFDIETTSKWLEQFYLDCIKEG